MNKMLFLSICCLLAACDGAKNPHELTPATITEFTPPLQAHHYQEIISEEQTVEALDFILVFKRLDKEPISRAQTLANVFGSLLINRAVADSQIFIHEHKLGRIEITSDAEFSENYPAGSSLNNLFTIDYYSISDGDYINSKKTPIDAYAVDLNYINYQNIKAPKLLQLRLLKAPTSEKTHLFTVATSSGFAKAVKVKFK